MPYNYKWIIMSTASEPTKKGTEAKRRAHRRQGINFANLKIIRIEEIPPSSRVSTPYKDVLRQITKGHSLELTEQEVSLETAAAAVRRLQKLPEFKDFTVTRRTVEGQKRIYIIRK
jgi:hypothetical protein